MACTKRATLPLASAPERRVFKQQVPLSFKGKSGSHARWRGSRCQKQEVCTVSRRLPSVCPMTPCFSVSVCVSVCFRLNRKEAMSLNTFRQGKREREEKRARESERGFARISVALLSLKSLSLSLSNSCFRVRILWQNLSFTKQSLCLLFPQLQPQYYQYSL